jgi:Ca-activated chloride channel homolog
MKYYLKKTTFIVGMLLICSLFSFTYVDKIFAESIEGSNGVDVVFVIDASGSMQRSDPQGLTSEAMKMFIDMCHAKGDKGGMVAYSDKIIKEYALKYMNSESDKSLLKGTLTGLELGNWTDIGLGLKRAVTMLKDGHDKKNRPIVILLSDGKNDPQRDKKASQDDLTAALNDAKAQHFPVYTIGLNADGTVDKNQLEAISKETTGKNFITNSAEELPRILREIFADNSKLKILQERTIVGNDDFQDVKINIPDSSVAEANISILSSKPVELKLKNAKGNEVKLPSEKILYTTSNNYSMLKLVSPEKGDWLLRIKGISADKMDISLISNYDLKAELKLNPDSNFHKGDKIELNAYVQSNGQKLDDKELYSTLKANIYVKNLGNGEIKQFPMQLQDGIFTMEFIVPDTNKYDIQAKIEGPGFIRESEVRNIMTENKIPTVTKKIEDLTLWNKKVKEVSLADYFIDGDNDKLSYSASSNDIDSSNLKVSGNNLIIQDGKWGINTITITVDDGKGGQISTELIVKIYPLLYAASGAVALLILILLIASISGLFKKSRQDVAVQRIEYKITRTTESPQYKARNHSMSGFAARNLMNLNLANIKLNQLRKLSLNDLVTEDTHDIIFKILILKKIDQSKSIYEREICEKIENLSELEKNQLFEALKRLYIDSNENFTKASYLIFKYKNINADNFDIIRILRDSPVEYDSIDNLIKYIMSIKGLAGVIRYLNHLSKYREDYGLGASYFEELLPAIIDEYSLHKTRSYRRLDKELTNIFKNIRKTENIT